MGLTPCAGSGQMSSFIHRINMLVLLFAALAIVWILLGGL
jgi:hypothetical protein